MEEFAFIQHTGYRRQITLRQTEKIRKLKFYRRGGVGEGEQVRLNLIFLKYDDQVLRFLSMLWKYQPENQEYSTKKDRDGYGTAVNDHMKLTTKSSIMNVSFQS